MNIAENRRLKWKSIVMVCNDDASNLSYILSAIKIVKIHHGMKAVELNRINELLGQSVVYTPFIGHAYEHV